MKELIRSLNRHHKNAQLASRASASLYTLVYFRYSFLENTVLSILDLFRNKKVLTEGRITGFTGIKRLGMNVYIQKYGIEGPVFASSIPPTNLQTPSFTLKSSTELQSTTTQRSYFIFDRVQIQIEVKAQIEHEEEELVLTLMEDDVSV